MGKKIVIIGGGVAGLSAGIYGQKNGYDTQIIEMHGIPGGHCTAWDRKGYRFDYCLHWLVGTASGPFHEIWKETGVLAEGVKVIDHEVQTRLVAENGDDFIIHTSLDRWEEYLLRIAPEDARAIRKMSAEMRRSACLEPFSDPPETRGAGAYLKALASMLPALTLIMKFGNKSCRDYFQRMNFKSPRLRHFLENLFGEHDFSALAFLMMLAWFSKKNAGYLIGGSLPLVERMTQKYRSLGGVLTVGKKVGEITVESDTATGVVLADGTKVSADFVISAADGHATIFDLLGGKYLSKEVEEAYRTWPLFTPLVQVSFGIRKKVEARYPVQTYLAKGARIGSTQLSSGYNLMNYSFDPTMAPIGCCVIALRFESPWENWETLDGDTYRSEKKQIEEDAILILERHHPGIKEHIEVIDVATPKTDVRYTGSWKGAYEGFLPSSRNITKTLKSTLPGLENFIMCGQWLFPGGGLPPAAQSGRWAIQLAAKADGKRFIR